MANVETATKKLDGHELALLNNRFESVVRAMTNTLLKTARSAILNTARDFSCCLLTHDHKMLAMAESLPIHVMSGPDLMAEYMAECHPVLKRGDAYLHNSPYHGNSHAADWTLLVPVMDDAGEHRFTVMAKAHLADCGNAVPTTYSAASRDVYEEGALIFPCVKVQEDYKNKDDIIRMAQVRIRVPELWYGDFLALLGAARIGERKLLEMLQEIEDDKLRSYPSEWFNYSEKLMIDAISRMPSGTTTTSAWHDPIPDVLPDGIEIKTTLTIDSENSEITVDLTDNPDCQPCGLNLTEATSRTAAMMAIFTGLGSVVPPNGGSFQRINVKLRENCCVGIPRHPHSCSVATTNLSEVVANNVTRAMAMLEDGCGMASTGKASPASTAVISGIDPRENGGAFVNQMMLGFTGGAAGPEVDGWLTIIGIGAAGFLMRDSVEIFEMKYPIAVYSQRLVTDSEGSGRFCGSPACEMEYGPLGCDIDAVWVSEGTTHPPKGVQGGHDGARAEQYVRDEDDQLSDPLGTYEHITVPKGKRIVSISSGGAGYGNPAERDVERVARDVRRNWISPERARSVYKVMVDASGNIDTEKTADLRAAA